MSEFRKCSLYYGDSPNYLVEYRGEFKSQIDKISYACGDIITDTIAVISTAPKNLNKLRNDVPSITFVDPRSKFVLQDISPSSVDNISAIKINPSGIKIAYAFPVDCSVFFLPAVIPKD